MSGPGESWHAIKKFFNPILKFRHPAVIWGLLYSKGYSGNGCSNAIIIIIIIYSCCCRSAYAIDHAPTDAGGACKTSSSNAIKCIIKLSAADARDLPALWLF